MRRYPGSAGWSSRSGTSGISKEVTMAGFYELTDEEVGLLVEALEYFKAHQGTYGDEETQMYLELKHYLETRERR
ncbi:hypothetical protein ES708_02598 [subsurface metagenome]